MADLQTTWTVGGNAARTQLVAGIYEKVSINGDGTFPADAVELTAEAVLNGLPPALAELVRVGSVPERAEAREVGPCTDSRTRRVGVRRP